MTHFLMTPIFDSIVCHLNIQEISDETTDNAKERGAALQRRHQRRMAAENCTTLTRTRIVCLGDHRIVSSLDRNFHEPEPTRP
jgi:hypothetical protein